MVVPSPLQVTKVVLIVAVRLFVATFKITGYLFVATYQAAWYAFHGQRYKIGDVIGQYGQATVDAVAEIFTIK
jgi:hypothetical protein